MAEGTKKSTKASQPETTEQLEMMAAFNGTAMEISTQAFQAYANGLATLNAEIMGFVNKRLQHDADLGRALSKCQNWNQAVEVQQEWAQKASEEYLAEASKLMETASTVARENWEPIYERANKSLAELQEIKG